jgi:hypothetical protein
VWPACFGVHTAEFEKFVADTADYVLANMAVDDSLKKKGWYLKDAIDCAAK